MAKKIGVVLSGCGHLDGSEIHESVATMLAINSRGATYEGIAPNRAQHHVVNHKTGEPDNTAAERNVLEEAARVARGDIIDLADANADDYDAIIFPGGFGAAKNLFDFALKGDTSYRIYDDVWQFIQQAREAGKPMGFICVAPVMMPRIFEGVNLTIGNDKNVAGVLESVGGHHHDKKVDEICVDHHYKVVSTPAYMLGPNVYEVSRGIDKLVAQVLDFCN